MKIKHFDQQSLWDRVAGDPELLRELVDLFAAEAPRMLARIEQAIKDGSPSGLEKASHKIKGSVLQFSAHTAAAIALKMEENGRRGSITDAEALLKKLKYEVDLLQKTLHVMVSDKLEDFRSRRKQCQRR